MSLDRVGDVDLYIGGLFSLRGKVALTKANITHVVSALRLPLDQELYKEYRHLSIELDDVDDEDIIEHFPNSNAFIQEGLDGGGGVLVHCAAGKSRSPTLVVAYLLSTHPDLTPLTALALIRQTRPFADPNPGFMAQLTLYHRMQCPTNPSAHPMYQHWLYERNVADSIACGRAPDAETIPFSDQTAQSTNKGSGEKEFKCRKCRHSLATSAHLIRHTPRESTKGEKCAHLFLEPLLWMKSELEKGELEGKLMCPNAKCTMLVGKYAWQGMRCSCGGWVVPGVSIARGRVDEGIRRGGSGGGKM